LKRGLDGKQFLLAHQKGEQSDLQLVECIMDVAQPFVFIFVVALSLIAEENDVATAVSSTGLAHLGHQTQALLLVRATIRIRVAHGFQQVGEERAFGMAWLVFGLGVIGGDLRVGGYFCPSPKKVKLVERFAWRDSGGLVPKG
jgi:uncharacterized membrane protein